SAAEVCRIPSGRSGPGAGKPRARTTGTGTGRIGPARLLPAGAGAAPSESMTATTRRWRSQGGSCVPDDFDSNSGIAPCRFGPWASCPEALDAGAAIVSLESAASGQLETGSAPPFRAVLPRPLAAGLAAPALFLAPGERIDDFEIVAELGRGGMG